MNLRERVLAVLNYQNYDHLPVVHFGFWRETLQKWAQEGHISSELAEKWGGNTSEDAEITRMIGFDTGWDTHFGMATGMVPAFEREVIKELPDGSRHIRNSDGVTVLERTGAVSIPAEIEHLLEDRESWEEHYKHRFEWSDERVTKCSVRVGDKVLPWAEGGLEYLQSDKDGKLFGVFAGSLYGSVRNILGVEGSCYIHSDDPELFDEIISAMADNCYRCMEFALKAGARFDFAHFWEDICYKNGPLITPSVFDEVVGPHYKRMTTLLSEYGINIVSLDCDGLIDALIPTWFENGVNTMFPIEVGTWEASIAPWREKYGRELRGVGGMNKLVFAHDKAAIDAEVERLRPLVELGGYIPCPDHRIPPDAKWDLVCYYAERMRKVFD